MRVHQRTLRRAAAVCVPVLLFLLLSSWAFSSTVGSSPDDDFHLAATWCGLGERDGLCEVPADAESPNTRLVPAPAAGSPCYASDNTQSGVCWTSSEAGLEATDRTNVDGLYPRLFYSVFGLFASPDVETSVITMRVVNSAIAVGLLTAVFFALPMRLRPVLAISVAGTVVPLGLFILASINPSSWALLSAATVWICLYATTQTTGKRRLVLASLTGLGAFMGAGARADAAAFAVLAVAIVGVLSWRRPQTWTRGSLTIPVISAVVVVAIAAVFYLSAGQSAAATSGLVNETPPLTWGQHVSNFLEIPSLWIGALGGWGLGWIDTPMPAIVPVFGVSVFSGAVFVGLQRAGWRRLLALAAAFATLWLLPLYLLALTDTTVGDEVQPRYLLPVMVIGLGVASLRADVFSAWRGTRAIAGGIALSAAAAVALLVNLRRYTTGLDGSYIPGPNPEWWWSFGPSPAAVWVIGSLAFPAALGILIALLYRKDPEIAPAAGGGSSAAGPNESGAEHIDAPEHEPRHARPDVDEADSEVATPAQS